MPPEIREQTIRQVMYKISNLNGNDQNSIQFVDHVLRTFSSTYLFQLKDRDQLDMIHEYKKYIRRYTVFGGKRKEHGVKDVRDNLMQMMRWIAGIILKPFDDERDPEFAEVIVRGT